MIQEFVDLHNAPRVAKGLGKVAVSAQQWADYLFSNKKFVHVKVRNFQVILIYTLKIWSCNDAVGGWLSEASLYHGQKVGEPQVKSS